MYDVGEANIAGYLKTCMWYDLRSLADIGIGTTFKDYKNWPKDHPLYPCTLCEDGLDFDCKGYRSLESINRSRKKRSSHDL